MDEILEQFLSEARDNLDYLDSHLKELDGGDEEIINSLFRAAHTLKGGAGLVGLTHIKEITHAAEDLLDAYRNKKIEYSSEMLNALYDAFDEVIELVDATEESGIDIAIDEEHINEIKDYIRGFLNTTSNEESEKIELPFIVDKDMGIDEIKDITSLLKITQKDVELDNDFITSKRYWVIDLNLSEDTIELGNDPFYLISMLEDRNIFAVSAEVYNPDENNNPLSLKTRMKVVCKSDAETIEDIFYNIIDEIKVSPLTLATLLQTEKESIQNETFEMLMQDIKGSDFEDIEQKLQTALDVINPETKEGFLTKRLLEISKIDKTFLPDALKFLGIETKAEETSSQEKETVLNILKAQKVALESDGAFERVRFVLKSVVSFLGVEKSTLNNMEKEEELRNFIDKMIEFLGGEKSEEVVNPEPKKKTQTDEKQKNIEQKHHTFVPKTVKIEQEEIDALMDIVGEILVIKNSLPYVAESINKDNIVSAKRELLGKYEEISRITDQLQDKVMGMRLLPLSYIFNRYPKLVRDMSKKLDKKIEYKEYGSETKLDKMMIEKLADPLVHVIRNSLDHGLETPSGRIASNKDESGVLTVGAKSEGDRVFIEISDDGQGIDIDKVINIALQKRLVDPDKLDTMSENEKLKLIFLPGLSTKDEITDLSGRGVGADAVNTTVHELGGKIKIQSKKGIGTTVILELPVSVALSNLFQIKLANDNYAIAMDSVIETDKITKDEIQTANHNPFIKLRENIIPLVLNETLLKRSDFKDEENIIIVKVADTQIALVADELVGQIDVVQKPLSGVLKNHPYINGISLLGNGEPLFIIKPDLLFKVA